MVSHIEIRQLTSFDQLLDLDDIQKEVWKMPPIPIHQTSTAMNNGGIIIGAYDNNVMIGFLYSFAGFNGVSPYLCSHMLGILPAYRKCGLGTVMKKKQAELAEKLGYTMITWTYDPLESKNAYINLHKLGAIGAFYHENHYGNLNDQLNQGLPTDRILIEWDLSNINDKNNQNFDGNKLLLQMGDDGKPICTKVLQKDLSKSNAWFVAIPNDFQVMKEEQIELAKKWRYESRKVFQALFTAEFKATDIMYEPKKQESYYVFTEVIT